MRDEILKVLSGRCLSAKDVYAELATLGLQLTLTDIIKELLTLEKEGLVRRVEGAEFNPLRPLTSSLWSAEGTPRKPLKAALVPPPAEEVMIIASLPLLNIASSVSGIVAMLDAIDSLISSAKEGLYLSTPFVDASLTTILARHYSEVSRLSFVRVMVDIGTRDIAVLERLKSLISNLEYKVFGSYRLAHGRTVKASGLHLKAIAADEKLALVGTFNFREAHIAADYDLGVMLRGDAASKIWKILDIIWSSSP